MGGGCLLFGGETWARSTTSPRPAVLGHLPVLIRLCSSVIHGHLALQRDDAVGTPRRLGDRLRVVDVRRPSTNASRSRAGAVLWRSPPTDEEGLDGTGEEGMGPTGPSGVFLCGITSVGLLCARGEFFS